MTRALKSVATIICAAAFAASVPILSTSALAKENSKEFLAMAIQGHNAEIKLGELAEQKASSQDVRDFGRMLKTDHTAGKEQVMSLASSVGITPPADLPKNAQKEYDKLAKLSGNDFDKEFVSYMVKDHKDDIHEYTEESKAKDNDQVAQLAKSSLPTLQKHLDMAQNIQKNMKK